MFNLSLKPDKIVWFLLPIIEWRRKKTLLLFVLWKQFFFLLSVITESNFFFIYEIIRSRYPGHKLSPDICDVRRWRRTKIDTNFLSLHSETTKRYFSWISFSEDIDFVFCMLMRISRNRMLHDREKHCLPKSVFRWF